MMPPLCLFVSFWILSLSLFSFIGHLDSFITFTPIPLVPPSFNLYFSSLWVLLYCLGPNSSIASGICSTFSSQTSTSTPPLMMQFNWCQYHFPCFLPIVLNYFCLQSLSHYLLSFSSSLSFPSPLLPYTISSFHSKNSFPISSLQQFTYGIFSHLSSLPQRN